jgi:hypothetical protein
MILIQSLFRCFHFLFCIFVIGCYYVFIIKHIVDVIVVCLPRSWVRAHKLVYFSYIMAITSRLVTQTYDLDSEPLSPLCYMFSAFGFHSLYLKYRHIFIFVDCVCRLSRFDKIFMVFHFFATPKLFVTVIQLNIIPF